MSIEDYSLSGLFLSAFLSSTLLPGGSELVLAALLAQQAHDPWTLFGVATAGNTLGGMSTWLVGMLISWRYPLEGLSKPQHHRAIDQIRQWGSPALLLSWVPIIGDPLCLAEGWLRVHVLVAFLLIGVGKAVRYAVIVLAM